MKTVNTTISLPLCVHNGGDMTQACNDSVLQQTYSDFELIIVNDASSDNSPQLLAAAAGRDQRIRVDTVHDNVGLIRALNIGLSLTKSRY
jgi:glycosyltransferase involved in cell wall biosynthesis